jgi:hypothetical protein
MAARPLCRLPIRCARAAPFRRDSGAVSNSGFAPRSVTRNTWSQICLRAPEVGTAGATRWLTGDGFRTGFDFDDLIKRVAVRTVESRPASRHKRPHTNFLIVGAKLPFPVVHSQLESASARQMKYVVIGFVLVFLPGVLVALVWGFAHGVIP